MELNCRMLIVDDTSFFLDILSMGFQQQGLQILTALNGKDAIKIIDEEGDRLDAVLSDYFLPDISGIRILDHFCRKKGGADQGKILGFIYSSKERFNDNENELLKTLPVQHLLKTEDPEKLIESVIAVLSKNT